MKNNNKIFAFCLAIIIVFSNFFSVCTPVYAADHGGGGGTNHDSLYKEKEKVRAFIKEYFVDQKGFSIYAASQVGAFVQGDFAEFAERYMSMEDYLNSESDIGVYVDSAGNETGFYLSQNFMTQLKALLDEYLKTEQTKEENGGFYLIPTMKFTDVPANQFNNGYEYQTFRNIMLEKGGIIYSLNYDRYVDLFSDPEHPKSLYFSNSSYLNSYLDNPECIVRVAYMCAYDWESEYKNYPLMAFEDKTKVYKSFDDAVKVNTLTNPYIDGFLVNGYDSRFSYVLFTTTGERVRVFVSQNALKNYSVGNRKVFVTNNYYDYEPEDLSVTIDDLKKGISDLQDIIDELMRRITDDTTEREIMELLRLILEEMRNQHSTGGGGGSGGDVTVNVDLSTTNNWLSKIYNKVSQISDRISSSAGQSMSEVVESIENLQEMLKKYLKEITGDLDDIKGQLEDMSEQEFNDKSDSFLDSATDSFSEISEVAKTKFPLSIPNDLRNLLAVIAPEPPEASTAAMLSFNQVEYNDTGPVPYDDMISVMDNSGGDAAHLSSNGAPVFHLPIVVESVGWDYAITVDLSGFQIVATLSRTFFTLIFIVGLIQLTIKVVGLWGDLVQ